jgi:murein DD-endopeptidase MepM/ murein hydrolase activator NlpD
MPAGRANDEETSSKWIHPLEKKGDIIATVKDHMARAFGNWMSDNALDISTKRGDNTLAVEDGEIIRTSGQWRGGSGNPDGFTVYLKGESGNEYAYMHHTRLVVSAGDKVKQGQILGKTGAANGVEHLHFATKPPLDPMDLIDHLESETGGTRCHRVE